MITMRYLNRLIQDGIEALKSLPVASSTEKAQIITNQKAQITTNQKAQISSFNFFYDLPETLKFLAQILVELRKYLKVSSNNDFNGVTQVDEVDGRKKHQVIYLLLSLNLSVVNIQNILGNINECLN